MILSWRRRRAGRCAGKAKFFGGNSGMELTIPTHFRCPISLELMKDPVTLSTGITYDRESIEKWIESGHWTCPVTNQVLRGLDQIPNHAIRKMIQDWCVENRSNGVERIPTPRIPVSPYEVSEIRGRVLAAALRGDAKRCLELVGKIKNWAKESERNKRCMVENGLGCVLSSAFESFSTSGTQNNEALLMEILWILTWMFPLGEEGKSNLGSIHSLRCMASFLKGEDLTARQNAVLVLKELSCSDHKQVDTLTEIEGVPEALFKIIQEPINPKVTKAALVTIYHMVIPSTETSEKVAIRFVEMGLVSLLLEIIVDADKSTCEKVLGVLDGLCGYAQGRENAKENALTMPVLVKKIARVSDSGTEFLVSILWKICESDSEGVFVIEALQLGAFQKLLVILQVGCGEITKEKATWLLKLLNQYRDWLEECFDSSVQFKYLKRPN